ncbi:hypothetical protein TEA_015581 [Camellia sinensis var. sinensis]|uniref:Uncharacterized protein n=1 Tax=Camellia sinensis var. sinensis TaxID=542762 RepID=A0A4S4D2S0_CAMSN|nr:hypothetical protein TEA_015581 [Camellia sinensis var. sinensis]
MAWHARLGMLGNAVVGFDLPTSCLGSPSGSSLRKFMSLGWYPSGCLSLAYKLVACASPVEVALTGACSASLNVLARSSGFIVLWGVIRFGRLRTPPVHSSSFVLGGKILPSASRGFLCCLPKEKEFSPYRVPIFASPPRGTGGTPKHLPCSVLSSYVAVSVAWPAGSYGRALGFRYTGSSTSVSPPSVRRSLQAIAAPASDRAGSVGRAYAVPAS